MGKLIKFLIGLIVVLVLLVIAAAVIVPLVVDPNDFKEDIVSQVKKNTGRDMAINGDIGLSVFPWLGVELGAVSLSQPQGFGDKPFAAVQQAQVRAKLMPLLKKQLEVDTVELHGLQLNLMRNKQGIGNWEDLAAGTDQAEQQQEQPGDAKGAGIESLAIGGVKLIDAQVSWDDRQSGQSVAVRDFSLETGALSPGSPADLSMSFSVDNKQPQLSARIGLSGTVEATDDNSKISVQPFELRIDGLKMADGLTADALIKAAVMIDLAANKLELKDLSVEQNLSGGPLQDRSLASRMLAQVSADLAGQIYRIAGLKLDATVKGESIPGGEVKAQLAAQITANLAKDTLDVQGLDLKAADLHLSGRLAGSGIQKDPNINGRLNLDEVNLRDLMARFGMQPPQTSDPDVLKRFSLSTDLKAGSRQAGLSNLQMRLDDSLLNGNAKVLLGDAMGYRFSLNLDSIDLDRYLPPPADKPAAGQAPVQQAAQPAAGAAEAPLFTEEQLAMLRGLDVDGSFTIGHLVVNKLKLDKAKITVKAKNGNIRVDQKVGAFYQGSLGGKLGLNVAGKTPKVLVTQRVKSVQAEQLVKDLAGEDRLSGTGNLNLDVNGNGRTVGAIKRTLGGKLNFAFTDGTVKGINLGRMLREAAAKLKGQTLPPDNTEQKTDFSELSGSAVINKGVLINRDLNAKSPLFRVTGKGKIDIGKDTLDYMLKPVLVASLEGQGGQDLERLKGVPIPVHLRGPLSKPKWSIDIGEALAESQKAKLKEKLNKELEKAIPADIQEKIPGGLDKQLNGVLKGLFN